MLVFVLSFLLLFSSCTIAEESGLNSLSNEELVILLRMIQTEIVNRHIPATANLAGGTYTIGKDIPAGSYTYTCMANGSQCGNLAIFEDASRDNMLFWKVVGHLTKEKMYKLIF